jgi:hypothetical protein
MSHKKKRGRKPLSKRRSLIWPFDEEKSSGKSQTRISFSFFQSLTQTADKAVNELLFMDFFLKGIWKTIRN